MDDICFAQEQYFPFMLLCLQIVGIVVHVKEPVCM